MKIRILNAFILAHTTIIAVAKEDTINAGIVYSLVVNDIRVCGVKPARELMLEGQAIAQKAYEIDGIIAELNGVDFSSDVVYLIV